MMNAMNADDVTGMLAHFCLKVEDAGGEDEEGSDLSALRKTEADYDRNIKYLSHFLAKAIKASGGDMESSIVLGGLNALRDMVTSPVSAEYDGTRMLIMPNLYNNELSLINRYSQSTKAWITVAKAPETELTCTIQIKEGWYHLGVYDSSRRPLASGYTNRENIEL